GLVDVYKSLHPPRHPYTAALLDAAPVPDPARQAQRRAARRPALRDARPGPGPGCPFAGRCPAELEACRTVPPPVPTPDGGAIACHAYRALPAAAAELPDQGAA
ncbi:MAG: ABC transporter ATP-binding protein, partial [Frankia sp.]|nr:ABC transporter ATP-binding protein [Frankia sp.]